ncbi:MAG: tetratricopeptide repeat protein [Bdellovibrionales bacterium]
MNRTQGIRRWIGFACALSVVAILSPAFAQSSKGKSKAAAKNKTVGELLKNIESRAREVKFNNKQKSALPQFSQFEKTKKVNLQSIKPPASSTLYYEEGTNEGELEKVTDQLISQAYKLTQQFKNSKRRGELWLRLAELYVEKSRLIEYRLQTEFDVALRKFQSGESKQRPKLNLVASQDYNRKAIQLYEWFLRDFPKDSKVDQALFFLGYNFFELGNETKGKGYYERLTKEFPESPYVDESNFALGEFYFDKEKWKEAQGYYQKVAQNKRGRLYSFALYKSAWCLYKTGQVKEGLVSLERVIRTGRAAKGSKDDSAGGVSRIRLATEAMKDLVVFYAEVGTAKNARNYFEKVAGEKNSFNLVEKLAYYFTDNGNRDGAKYLFEEMIELKPHAPKAYDYQYQIVSMYAASGNNQVFKEELYQWISTYGPDSAWYKANSANQDLVAKASQLIETTLRNYVLQQHQTAQNSHAEYSQKLAKSGYELYFNTFKESSKLDEMHFFFAELLFDMKDYERAAYHYTWIGDNAPKSKYFEKAMVNAVLALEKKLPTPEQIRKVVGENNEPVEFDKTLKSFEKAALAYAQAVPKGENTVPVRYKLGSLYYYYNQFDKALAMFTDIIEKHPKTQYAEFAANLTLDIYNIKKDYAGLEKAGKKILAIPELASSAVGGQIKNILQRASFKKAQDLEGTKDFLKSAEAYESFAKANPATELAPTAYYNSAVNYERAGDLFKALGMYAVVLSIRGDKHEGLKKNASKFAASLYEKTGQYAKAADAFEAYASKNQKDKEAVNFYFNAGAIRDGMNHYQAALNNYQKYFDLSRNKDRNEVPFLMAKVWERRNNPRQALKYYLEYHAMNPSNAGGLVESTFAIAKIYERLGNRKQMEEWYKKTIAIQRRVSRSDNPIGVQYAAEAKFHLVYKTYEELRSIRIPANPANQGKAVQQKLAVLERLKNELGSVIKYDDGYQVVASLALIGQAYQHMAAAIYSVPIPKALDAEGVKQYKAGVDGIAKPFQEKAIENYQSAIDRGRQLEGYNDWMKVAFKELTVLSAGKYSDGGEKVIPTKLPDWLGN